MRTGLPLRHCLKLEILERGIDVSDAAAAALAAPDQPFVVHDYATTGGLTIVIGDDVWVNAPVEYWFCDRPVATLTLDDEGFVLVGEGVREPVRVMPLPGYLASEHPPRGLMTHADRIRISPIDGCAYACVFCDWHDVPYQTLAVETLLDGLRIAAADSALPPRHVLISGGTPRAGDHAFLASVYRQVIAESPLPVDVMLAPRDGHALLNEIAEAGVHGLSINLEIFDDDTSARLCPNKHHTGRDGYGDFISHAVSLLGGHGSGRVRSLLLCGLEPAESTLEGVRFLASLGCDPVLSPFRPAEGTPLSDVRPPSADELEALYLAAISIVDEYGVRLGPRCIPCQHNTVTFPDGSDAYYTS